MSEETKKVTPPQVPENKTITADLKIGTPQSKMITSNQNKKKG